MKEEISKVIAKVVGTQDVEGIMHLMEIPPDRSMGDLAIPCFSFAKTMHKNPALIANDLKEALLCEKEKLGLHLVKAVNGYCNLFIDRAKYIEKVFAKCMEENEGVSKTGVGKTICIDYSSPNIAKNFHVGHLRTTVIGNSLYQIYQKLGYRVVRINHLGDWGTQFGKLIVAYKKWSCKEKVEQKGIEELLDIYVKFNQEAETQPELMDEARSWFVKMEQGDEEALAIWEWFKEISMVEFERVYDMLGISFDTYMGESYYRNMVPKLAEELKEKNLLIESQGANVIDLSAFDMPPCMITKKDGGSIYHSRDIAAVLYRKEHYHFDKCLYVTGMEQCLHFKQVFKAIELMGYEWYSDLIHIPYGLVSLEGAKLSSRKGNVIYAEDILNEAVKRAAKSIKEKNPELSDKNTVAKRVGIGAVIFHDLFHQRIKNVDFSWDDVLSFEGTTGPYVQYTYARAKSILRKNHTQIAHQNICYESLADDVTFELVKMLNGYENAIRSAADHYEPSIVARYVMSLSSAFNKFYHECPILQEENEACKTARLKLVTLVTDTIRDACGLLGMDCPEEM